jgi:hypothetical protein
MVEVFRTNVIDPFLAVEILSEIQSRYSFYRVNFDLQDVDHILRISCERGSIETGAIIQLLSEFGCDAGVLADEDFVTESKLPYQTR